MNASELASALVKIRWARIPKAERAQHVPHNGGRPRLYPECPHYRDKGHRWNLDGRCKCGQRRKQK